MNPALRLYLIATACGLGLGKEARAGQGLAVVDVTTASRSVTMPKEDVKRSDEYRCIFHPLEEGLAIKTLVPRPSSLAKVHHMTLYTCTDRFGVSPETLAQTKSFQCQALDSQIDEHCTVAMGYDGMMLVQMHRQHPDAPLKKPSDKELGLFLPKGYGIHTGAGGGPARFTLLQVHNNLPIDQDESGFEMELTNAPISHDVFQKTLSCGDGLSGIPAGRKDYKVSCSTPWHGEKSASALQLHYHFHNTGTEILFEIRDAQGMARSRGHYVAARDEQNFRPKKDTMLIHKGDSMFVQCNYDTTRRTKTTNFGPRSTDEMCNVFVVAAQNNAQVDLLLDEVVAMEKADAKR